MPVLPLSSADALNRNTGQASDVSSTSVTLTGGVGSGTATAGTTLLVSTYSGTQLATPSGWTKDQETGTNTTGWVAIWRRTAHSTGDASWTFSTVSGTTGIAWQVWEMDRLLGTETGGVGGNGTTIAESSQVVSTVSTQTLTRNDVFVVGGLGIKTTHSPASLAGVTLDPTAWATVPYSVTADLMWPTEGSNNLRFLATNTFLFPVASLTQSTIIDDWIAGGSGGGWAYAISAYESVGSGRPDPLDFATGFEYGLTPNTSAPLAGLRMVDIANGTFGTQYAVSSAAPRSGTYHLRISQSAAAGRLGWNTDTFGTAKDDVAVSFGVKINSSTGTVVVAEVAPASGTILQLVYDTSTTQLGLRWGGGSIAYQTQTTPTGAYVWVDLLVGGFTGTTWSASWSLEEGGHVIEQDGPANLTSQTPSSLASVTVGLNASQTCQFDIDDVCLSTDPNDYPLGKHKHVLLVPDTASISGTSGNFRTFTANGTLATWNDAAALAAIDEVPPNISGTADGIVQITADAASDMLIDFGGYTTALGEVIDCVQVIAPLWANSTQSATLRFQTIGVGTVNHLTTATAVTQTNAGQPASATVPMWLANKVPRAQNWTSSSVASVGAFIGASSDATPDIGVHAVYLEVSVREALTARIYGPDEDGMTVDVTRGGGSYAVQTYEVATGPTRGATLRYVRDGAEVVQVIAAADTLTETVESDNLARVSQVTVEPDPLP